MLFKFSTVKLLWFLWNAHGNAAVVAENLNNNIICFFVIQTEYFKYWKVTCFSSHYAVFIKIISKYFIFKFSSNWYLSLPLYLFLKGTFSFNRGFNIWRTHYACGRRKKIHISSRGLCEPVPVLSLYQNFML